MEGEPLWFGPSARPLFATINRPSGSTARAVVVLCPSLGQESAFTFYTMRDLAADLAEAGFLALRFDYDGTGDSAGVASDPHRIEAWERSIGEAVALARSMTDAPVVLLGMRLGGLLAGEFARHDPGVHGLVLWDAPRSGSAYLRELRIRQHVGLGHNEQQGDAFTGLGLDLRAEATAELARLDLRKLQPAPAERALVVTRTGHRPALTALEGRTGQPVDRLDASDQDDLLLKQTLPLETQRKILAWFESAYPDTGSPVRTAARRPSSTGAHLQLPHGTERTVRLGPHRLFGILHEPANRRTSTTVVFIPEFHTPHVGLSGVWTDLARAWGEQGVASLRFDVSGCGESEPRPGLPGHRAGIVEHMDDLAEVLDAVCPADPDDVVLIGVCSGAYLAVERALSHRPRAVALINPILSYITPEDPVSPRRRALRLTRGWLTRLFGGMAGRFGLRMVRTNRVQTPTLDLNFEWHRALEGGYWQDYLFQLNPRVPRWVWALVNRLVMSGQTAPLLGRLVQRGTKVLLFAGELDWDKLTIGSARQLEALARRGGLRLVHEPRLDHALMRPGMRRRVIDELSDFVLPPLLTERWQESPEDSETESATG